MSKDISPDATITTTSAESRPRQENTREASEAVPNLIFDPVHDAPNKPLSMRRADIYKWSPLFLRLVMGYGFMVHGWAKLSHGPANFEKLITQIGAPFPHVTAWMVPCVELCGGFALILGAFTAVAAIPLIGVMLVAIFTVHLKYGFSAIKTIGLTPDGPIFGPPGYEVALLYVAGLITLIIGGSGALSVDSVITKSKAALKT